ncbi:MAG: methyltransferase domain-containing protein [Pseudomonadota bacterium]|nr:methyltransferase domain-containing protein [Pseudomonadota bacterium]
MLVEEIEKNYNKLGIEIIETIYTDDYLSIGGTASTEDLALLAGVTQQSRVLEIGSGVGGPALHLAATYGCSVVGLDLVETNVAEANERAKARQLDHLVSFQQGDALDLPFAGGAFDVIWGQDAWCHVPDKAKLIEEIGTVLSPGGTVAFTDWIETGPIEGKAREDMLAAMAAPNIATLDDYKRYLESNGCTVVHQENASDLFVSQYRAIMSRLVEMRETLSNRFSARVFEIVVQRNNCILEAFQCGALGGGRVVARKR